jgi:hypothetical protein
MGAGVVCDEPKWVRRFPIALAALAMLAAGAFALDLRGAAAQDAKPAAAEGGTQASAPSDAEVRERAKALIANQHRSDVALDEYERIERYVDRTAGKESRVTFDKTYRVVPTGGGTIKLLIKDQDQPSDPAEYQRQLHTLRDILEMMANPDDPKAKAAYAKYQKRKQDRNAFVDVAGDAFLVKWSGSETYKGFACDVFELDPNPNFHPHSMFQEALAHVRAKIWVDRASTQLVRGEANVLSDIYFGGGILGKLARGSSVSLEQGEVEPGLWEPVHYEYNYNGRRFLFSFEQHQTVDASHYKYIGPPQKALGVVEGELAAGKPFAAAQ